MRFWATSSQTRVQQHFRRFFFLRLPNLSGMMEPSFMLRVKVEGLADPCFLTSLPTSQPVTPLTSRLDFRPFLTDSFSSSWGLSLPAQPPSSRTWTGNHVLLGLPTCALGQTQIFLFVASGMIFLDPDQVTSLNSVSLSWDKTHPLTWCYLFATEPHSLTCPLPS